MRSIALVFTSWWLFFLLSSFLISCFFLFNKFIVDVARTIANVDFEHFSFPSKAKRTNEKTWVKHVLTNFKTVSELFCFSLIVAGVVPADGMLLSPRKMLLNWNSPRLANKTNYNTHVCKQMDSERRICRWFIHSLTVACATIKSNDVVLTPKAFIFIYIWNKIDLCSQKQK